MLGQIRKGDIVAGKAFYTLLYNDRDFTAQLGRSMLAAGKLEVELKTYLARNAIIPKTNQPTLGHLIGLLRNHGLLPKMLPHLEMVGKQRNYLAHNLYALLSGKIPETLLPRTDLIVLDVYTYTEKVRQFEESLEVLTDIVKRERIKLKTSIRRSKRDK